MIDLILSLVLDALFHFPGYIVAGWVFPRTKENATDTLPLVLSIVFWLLVFLIGTLVYRLISL